MLRLSPQRVSSSARHAIRLFSSTAPSLSSRAVDLAADVYAAPSSGSSSSSAPPLVILHGLYGSKQNWRSLAKGLAQKLERDVHALDLRNHGTSPHSPQVTYSDMASDVGAYIDKQGLNEIALLGHSMGGKVAMSLTLTPHKSIQKLIVVDISPAVGPVSPDFQQYLDTMKSVDAAGVKTRKEADEILKKAEPDFGVRAFLLTNLIPSEENPGTLRFRLPLQHFDNVMKEIGEFPYPPFERTWDGPALFVKGGKSKYINKRNIPVIEGYFPRAKIETLDAGHWVHAEKPKEFVELLDEFVRR